MKMLSKLNLIKGVTLIPAWFLSRPFLGTRDVLFSTSFNRSENCTYVWFMAMLKVTEVSESQEMKHNVLGSTSRDIPKTSRGKNMWIIGREAQFVLATQFFSRKAKLPRYWSLWHCDLHLPSSCLSTSRTNRSGLCFSQLSRLHCDKCFLLF